MFISSFTIRSAKDLCTLTIIGNNKAIERYLYTTSIALPSNSLVKVYTLYHNNKRYNIAIEIVRDDQYEDFIEFKSLSEKIQNHTASPALLMCVDEFDEFVKSIKFIE